jgi:hypothetical protein
MTISNNQKAVTSFTEDSNVGKQNNVIKWNENVVYTN